MKRRSVAPISLLVFGLVLALLAAGYGCGGTKSTTTTTGPATTTTIQPSATSRPPIRATTEDSTTSTPPASSQSFSDISSSPYESAIEYLAQAGIIGFMDDYQDGTFRPQGNVLRAEFAKMIVLGLGLPVTEGGIALSFTDVEKPADDLYPDDYVAVAVVNGLIQGYPDGYFKPDVDITRAQLLTVMVRACQLSRPSAIQEPPAGWIGVLPALDPAHGANVARAECSGLLSGIDLEAFDINGKATRGEIAQIIWNIGQR